MTHDDARDAMPLFVVDADDAPTRAALMAHVAECDACRETLREYQLAANSLAQSVPQIRPRAELRAKTLAAIVHGAAPGTSDGRPLEFRSAPVVMRRATATWPQWLAAAAALVAVASLGGLMRTRSELSGMRETLAVWQARVAQAEQSASASRTELVTHRQTLNVMTSDDLLQVALKGVAPAGRAEGRAFLSRASNALIFSARDLPALPPDRVYQLWAIADGKPVSAGLFTPDARGRSQLVTELALSAPPVAFAVTVEPRGGVPSPTGPKYLLGTPAE